MEDRRPFSVYRVSKRVPPPDREYLTPQDKLGPPPADAPEEKRRSWDALSVFDAAEGARLQAERFTHLGKYVVRYDIPVASGITLERSGEAGHLDLRGDVEELKGYLSSDFLLEVKGRGQQGAR